METLTVPARLDIQKWRSKRIKTTHVIDLYGDGDVIVLVQCDKNQRIGKLLTAFNKQDHPDTDPNALGFKDFMLSKGVTILKAKFHDLNHYL